jgi:hypothetical protein
MPCFRRYFKLGSIFLFKISENAAGKQAPFSKTRIEITIIYNEIIIRTIIIE